MITKVSEITESNIADYIRLTDASQEELNNLKIYLGVAKDFILNNTGITDLDKYNDLVIVVYVLCQDMYDNRTLYVDKTNLNHVVKIILGMHSVNLL